MEQRFLPLLIVTLLAFFIPLFLSRWRSVPIVVGEILAGILIGPSLLGWIRPDEPTLEILAEIGFAFLMFLSGLEIDFAILRLPRSDEERAGPAPVLLSAVLFGLTLALAFLVSEGFYRAGYLPDPWMLTLILSTTSLGIVVPVLKERRLLTSRLGQTLLLSALLADFLTMFFITVYVTVHVSGLSFDILLVGLLFVPLVAIYLVANKHLKDSRLWSLLDDLSGATAQIKVRGAFALMMSFVVLAESLGMELILGAFLGGVLVSLISTPQDEAVRSKLDAIGYGFFIPLFFIDVGVQFNLHALAADPRAWLFFPLLLGAALLIKLAAALVLRVSFSWRETLSGGFLLSARLSLIVAASAIGLRLGVISEAINASIVLTAAVTATLSPLLFNAMLPAERRISRPVMLVYGNSTLALQVARYLQAHQDTVYFVAWEPQVCQRLQEAGMRCLPQSGPRLAETLEALPADMHIQAMLALSEDDERNLEACRQARQRGIPHLVAFTEDPARLAEYQSVGAQVLAPALFRPSLLGLMARNPAIFALLTTTTDDKDLREIRLDNARLDGKRVRDIALPQDTLILAIRRNGELLVPHGDTRLELHDYISVLGTLASLEDIAHHLGANG